MKNLFNSIPFNKKTLFCFFILLILVLHSSSTSAATYQVKKDNTLLEQAVYLQKNNSYQNSILSEQSQYYWIGCGTETSVKLRISGRQSPSFSFQIINQKGTPLSTKSYEFIPSSKTILARFSLEKHEKYLLIIKNLYSKKTKYTVSYLPQKTAKKVSKSQTTQKNKVKKTKSKSAKQKAHTSSTTNSSQKSTITSNNKNTKKIISKPKHKSYNLTLNKSFIKIQKGQSFSLVSKINCKKASGKVISWKVANASLLRLKNNLFTGRKTGITSICCLLSNNPKITANCTVKITK